jgi:hypothetical protein
MHRARASRTCRRLRSPPATRGTKGRSPAFVPCVGMRRGHDGSRNEALRKNAQAQHATRDDPASRQCEESSYRPGKASLAIARSGTVWARRCGQSMNRTSRRSFPRISRTCSNGWTSANGVRGLRDVPPTRLDDHRLLAWTLRPSAPRRGALRARHPFSESSRSGPRHQDMLPLVSGGNSSAGRTRVGVRFGRVSAWPVRDRPKMHDRGIGQFIATS